MEELLHLPMVVGQASCLSVAAEKLRESFPKGLDGLGRLEACPTNQCCSDFEIRDYAATIFHKDWRRSQVAATVAP
jgi:hypothetical protein